MSLCLKAIITLDEKFKNNSADLQDVSDACFKIVLEACKRKIAINQLICRDDSFKYINLNEIMLVLSNSYVFCEVEPILCDEYSIPFPSPLERLKNLQGLIEFILDLEIVEEVKIVMYDDGNDEFEEIKCCVKDFAIVMREKLFQKISFAYICKITKK